jgi:UDP-GlcNAc:undecaprenyl-phosphate GlcNAc-1-phosphate transferase
MKEGATPSMLTLLIILGLSCGICLAITPTVRILARRCKLLDLPDKDRKFHGHPIPMAGGLAILIAMVSALFLASVFGLALPNDRPTDGGPDWLGVMLASLVIFLVGMIDDCGRLRGRHKLLGQFIAVGILLYSGLSVRDIMVFHHHIKLGLLSQPFLLFWMLGAINSLNLLDGMDGSLSVLALIVCVTLGTLAMADGHGDCACLALALAGALLGFLCYNFPPASIFLGDCGSMLIGLLVGVLALRVCQPSRGTLVLAIPAVLLIIPILDTAAAVLRRKLEGKSIYDADRGHLHHCLLRRGLSPRMVLLWICCLCMVAAAGALVSRASHNDAPALLTAGGMAGFLIAGRIFAYPEFMLLFRRLSGFGSLFYRSWGLRAFMKSGTSLL